MSNEPVLSDVKRRIDATDLLVAVGLNLKDNSKLLCGSIIEPILTFLVTFILVGLNLRATLSAATSMGV